MRNLILTKLALLFFTGFSTNLIGQHSEYPKNLSWEEKVSSKYSYNLPQNTENQENNKLISKSRPANQNQYEQLLSQREELKFQIARHEKMDQNDKIKQYLDKYRASLAHIEKQINEYITQEKKPKTSK